MISAWSLQAKRYFQVLISRRIFPLWRIVLFFCFYFVGSFIGGIIVDHLDCFVLWNWAYKLAHSSHICILLFCVMNNSSFSLSPIPLQARTLPCLSYVFDESNTQIGLANMCLDTRFASHCHTRSSPNYPPKRQVILLISKVQANGELRNMPALSSESGQLVSNCQSVSRQNTVMKQRAHLSWNANCAYV